MASAFLPVKYIRILKLAFVLLPFLVLIFGLACIIATIDNPDYAPRNRFKRKETVNEMVERTGVCDRIHDGKERINGSYVQHNDSVIRACDWLLRTTDEYYRVREEKVSIFKHDFVIPNDQLCDADTDTIVLIHSLHDYYDRRKAIRETWGGAIKRGVWPQGHVLQGVKVAFVLGLNRNHTMDYLIRQESNVYNDIIQGDFLEHYHNMTLKSLLGLKWIINYCPNVKYLIKSDDDMIINIPYLFKVLSETDMSNSIMGPFNGGSRVYRKGKWAIDHKVFPFYYYPPYESGSAYIISGDLIRPLYETAEYVPPIFIDDVYITGIIGKIIGVKHKQHDGFAFWTNKKPQPCDIMKNKVLTGTKMKPKDLVAMWDIILKNNSKC